ncbi:YeeE/YedE thiosulfate transporter family protein [Spirochaeta dissipatitropha]
MMEKKTRKNSLPIQFAIYFPIGLYFGIVLSKAEVISWYRIQEMFAFQSFHMYGIIGSAVITGALSILLVKSLKLKAPGGGNFNLEGKPFNKIGNISGGIIFGMGWALTGACPGPLYALVGLGYYSYLIAIAFALLGVISYGKLKPNLPH